MTEETEQETPTLEGEAALELWRQGRKAWNSWVDQHPGLDISFAGVDFSPERVSEGNLSFAGYRFGDGNVDFSDATFGKGDVHFFGAKFGDGKAHFRGTFFGAGNVFFSGATFGTAIVDFSWATFGDGQLVFAGATFDEGFFDFSWATFGKGGVSFINTNFKDVDVGFSGTTFRNSEIKFRNVQITDLNFSPNAIESSDIKSERLSIKRRAIFDLPSTASTLKSFNLHSASFDGPLTLKGDLSIIPDLRATRNSHQVDLSDLKVKLPRTSIRFGWPPKLVRKSEDPQDGARLRRLKEIAETNKDHQAALRFSADENRAKRWIETSWFGSVLDMAFSAFSDYGQNILRPFVALIVVTAASMGAYKTLATATFTNWWTGWAQGAVLSASNSLPFLPQSRDLRTDALTALYGTTTTPDLWVNALMITQGVLSFVFLFLIGLGLRNRFRL